jgi:hypothetical protein
MHTKVIAIPLFLDKFEQFAHHITRIVLQFELLIQNWLLFDQFFFVGFQRLMPLTKIASQI